MLVEKYSLKYSTKLTLFRHFIISMLWMKVVNILNTIMFDLWKKIICHNNRNLAMSKSYIIASRLLAETKLKIKSHINNII